MFGVEITDSRCYGCGTSDGTFNKIRYFTCPDNNGLFLSLASVTKQPDWLKLEYHPNRAWIPEAIERITILLPFQQKEVPKNHLRHQHHKTWRLKLLTLTLIHYLMEQE
eukprot:Em0018g616a